MYVVSPWSRGGWVNSQVFDHSSVIRLLEQRFGVHEPNISPWRRAVCGDLTSAFDFARPNRSVARVALPATAAQADRAKAVPKRLPAMAPAEPHAPIQTSGVRRSRALPYALEVRDAIGDGGVALRFENSGSAGAVFHVYDRHRLDRAPRRYTVEPGAVLTGEWEAGDYDLWVLGPNGFHRHFAGSTAAGAPQVSVRSDPARPAISLTLHNTGPARTLEVRPMAYATALAARTAALARGATTVLRWPLGETSGWYDLAVRMAGDEHFLRRFAGRIETGRDSLTDPAMHGEAILRLPV
jgi:phospholipase C